MNLIDGSVYTFSQLKNFINEVKKNELKTIEKGKGKNRYEVYNIPCAFDIETTSVTYGENKHAFMYIWMFGICGISIYGRTWDEYITTINTVVNELEISDTRRLIVYVHNLAYEFQFMRKLFKWSDIFSMDTRKPIYARTTQGIEYRCSYILTCQSLAKVGEGLRKYIVHKMVGDLDYELCRTHITKITDEELGYCINDIRVVMAFIQETIEQDGNIGKIPLTKTGYVRQYVRNKCFEKNRSAYSKAMRYLTITVNEYTMLKKAFQGGFTHANALYSGTTMTDVTSYDFTSSYPTVMLSEKFPMSKGKIVTVDSQKEFFDYLKNYCCLFSIEMRNLKLKNGMADCPISTSKCEVKVGIKADNGRVYEADRIVTTITEQDFIVYSRFYDFTYRLVGDFYIYNKAYLPKPIIESILKFYNDKTTLKDVEGREVDYMLGKGMLNSIYGMIVMDVIRDEIVYNNDSGWELDKANILKQVEEYNNNKNRFMFYPWGVWVTAYARRNLFTGLYECGNDYVYSDTDSMKILHVEEHIGYINQYNENIKHKIEKCLAYFGLPLDAYKPKTIEGVEKPLGVWDFDGYYTRFKTLGAKRYMVECKGKIKTTIAGVGKKQACDYINTHYDNPFDAFENNLTIPEDYTGKLTHTYIDDEWSGLVTDYEGNTVEVYSPSAVHLEKASFSLSLTEEYLDFIMGYKEEYCL